MLLVIEIIMLCGGIAALATGHYSLSPHLTASGIGARIAGLILMLPLPVCFAIGFAWGQELQRQGNVDPDSILWKGILIEAGITFGCFVLASVIALAAPQGYRGRRSRRTRPRWDDEDLPVSAPTPRRPRRTDDDDDDEDEALRRRLRRQSAAPPAPFLPPPQPPPLPSALPPAMPAQDFVPVAPRSRRALHDEDDVPVAPRPRPRRDDDEEEEGGSSTAAWVVAGVIVGVALLAAVTTIILLTSSGGRDVAVAQNPLPQPPPPPPPQVNPFPQPQPVPPQPPQPNPLPVPKVEQPPVPKIEPPPKVDPPVAKEEPKNPTRVVNGLTVTEVSLQAKDMVPALCWAEDGKSFFYLEAKGGTLHRVDLDGFTPRKSLPFGRPCSWLALSAEGLLVTLQDAGEVRLVNPETFEVTTSILVPGVTRTVSSPKLSVAFAWNPDTSSVSQISALDLKKSKVALIYPGPNVKKGANIPLSAPVVTADGDYLIATGGDGQLARYRIKGTKLIPEEASRAIASGRAGEPQISIDGEWVCLPTGGGNHGGLPGHPAVKPYSTYIYPAKALTKPVSAITSGGYPERVGFDPKLSLAYGQNFDHQLMIFDLLSGAKRGEYQLSPRGDGVRQFLVHPQGGKLFVLTGGKLFFVEVPNLKGPG
ncbi:MAG: hypothetical protein L0Z62_31420 [Gemmataceae bacterium]|nr:hypothetical protein [Gemmataceae bacterium]